MVFGHYTTNSFALTPTKNQLAPINFQYKTKYYLIAILYKLYICIYVCVEGSKVAGRGL